MTSAQILHKGVTPPISTSMPSQAELASNDALVEELKRQNNFESPVETDRRFVRSYKLKTQLTIHRKKVLGIFQKVATEFVKEVMTSKKKFPQSVINAAGGKIFTYGSYRLGVYGPGMIIVRFSSFF
jgi:poly(A) polymerase